MPGERAMLHCLSRVRADPGQTRDTKTPCFLLLSRVSRLSRVDT